MRGNCRRTNSFCAAASGLSTMARRSIILYAFWLHGERRIKEIAPDLPIRWINAVAEPAEVERRGGWTGCIVNATPIRSFVPDRNSFQREVREALGATPPD